MTGRFLAVLAAAALAGCATDPRLPADWGAGVRLRSEHFALETDADAPTARAFLATAERTYGEYVRRFELDADPADGDRIRLLLFHDPSDYGRFHGVDLPSRAEVEAEQRRLEQQGWVVIGSALDTASGHLTSEPDGTDATLALSVGADSDSVLRHELAHFFTARVHGPLPAWLDEGIAETLRFEGDRARGLEAASEFRRMVIEDRAVPLDALLGLRSRDFAARRDPAYRTAWALVRHLVESGGLPSLRDLSGVAAAADRARETLSLADLALRTD